MGERRRGVPRWLLPLAIIVLAVQLLAVYLPGSMEPIEVEIPYVDKAVHLLIFGVPTYLFGRWSGRTWLVGGIFLAHGALSEVIQGFIPYRDPDVFDFAADAVGVALAVVLLVVAKKGTVRLALPADARIEQDRARGTVPGGDERFSGDRGSGDGSPDLDLLNGCVEQLGQTNRPRVERSGQTNRPRVEPERR